MPSSWTRGRPSYRYSMTYPGEPLLELSPDLLTAQAALAWQGRSNYHALCGKYGLREDYAGMKTLRAVGFVRSNVSSDGKRRRGQHSARKAIKEYELTRKGLARVIVHHTYFLSQSLKNNEKSKGVVINLMTVPGTLLFITTSASFRKLLPRVAKKMKTMILAVGNDPTFVMLQEVVSTTSPCSEEWQNLRPSI